MKPLNRRRFLQGAAALAPLLGSQFEEFAAQAAAPAAGLHTLFVGTQTVNGSQGIYAYHWDAEHGQIRLLGLAAATPMPTFLVLSRDRKLLFACNETEMFEGAPTGAVSSFSVEGEKLQPINSAVAGGPGTTNLTLDHTDRVLLCANYTGGSDSSFPVSPDGHIGHYRSHFQYTGHGPNHDRQEAPHVHRATVSPGNGFALFNDLGLDVIHIYRLDVASATLQPHTPAAWHAPAGAGPRSLRFHPNGRWAYCVTEMGSTVIVLDWNENTGVLTTKQQVSLIPAGFTGRSQAAETAIDSSGRFLYAADRFYDGLYSFEIDAHTGELHGMVRTPVDGKTPRYITLDPTERWLLAANQDSNDISIFPRNPETGRLAAKPSQIAKQIKPQCLVFV